MNKMLCQSLSVLSLGAATLLVAQPAQAQLQVQSGNINAAFTFAPSSPPKFELDSVDVNSVLLNLDGGRTIENFEGAMTLTQFDLQGLDTNTGLAQPGTSGSFSGQVTGRSFIGSGQFLVFDNTPISLQGNVLDGNTVPQVNGNVIQTGNVAVTGGSIQTNATLTDLKG